jgi:hypothetical protein
MLRMPQVGERWRLRPRIAEVVDPCGCEPVPGEIEPLSGLLAVVLYVSEGGEKVMCWGCKHITEMHAGWPYIDTPSVGFVPYTWLEPVTEEETL